MNFGRDCGSVGVFPMEIFLYGMITYAVVTIGFCLIDHYDEAEWLRTKREKRFSFVCSLINGVLIAWIGKGDIVTGALLSVLAGCLLFACCTDCKTCEVFQFTWWAAGMAGGLLVVRGIFADIGSGCPFDFQAVQRLPGLLLYGILQELFFGRMYGRADCHGFFICAAAECSLGMGFAAYVQHMAIAFAALAVVHASRHNINRRGNLKRPVAFLPYITISFWIVLIFQTLMGEYVA